MYSCLKCPCWLIGAVLIIAGAIWLRTGNPKNLFHKYDLVRLNVQLGNVGSVELRPNNEDVQIAHRIWTELITRKAAQPIDIEHDVIVEIYNSWYALLRAREAANFGYSRSHAPQGKKHSRIGQDCNTDVEQRFAATPHAMASAVPALV